MRTLKIRRDKTYSVVGSYKVYVEDRETSDIVIDGVPCRKIGILKNGAEGVYEIPDGEVRVYVISGKLSRNYCFDVYKVPEGYQEICLSGHVVYNPTVNHAFRFDNNDGVEVAECRARARKKGIRAMIVRYAATAVIVIALIAALAILAAIETPAEFTFENMSITLTDHFREYDRQEHYLYLDNGSVGVTFESLEYDGENVTEDMTEQDIAELIILGNDLKDVEIKQENGLTCSKHSYTSGITYVDEYLFVYKTGDGFYVVVFLTTSNNKYNFDGKVFEWAGSVRFSNVTDE